MKRIMLPALLVAAMLVSPLMAEDKAGECPISAAMKNLPQITFAVGEETTHCSKTASKLAESKGVDLVYLVGKEKFSDEGKANFALLTATEKFVNDFANPKVCKVSGTTSIAGQKTECSVTAAKLTGLMTNAMKTVKLSYAVGDEACDCPHAAASLAKASGEPKLFVVGKEKTECEITGRLNLARAKYRAMVEALAKAEKEAAAESKES